LLHQGFLTVEDGFRESAATIRISSKRKVLAAAATLYVFFDHIEALERCHVSFYVLSSTIEEHPELIFQLRSVELGSFIKLFESL
jgi:hypothetical protein